MATNKALALEILREKEVDLDEQLDDAEAKWDVEKNEENRSRVGVILLDRDKVYDQIQSVYQSEPLYLNILVIELLREKEAGLTTQFNEAKAEKDSSRVGDLYLRRREVQKEIQSRSSIDDTTGSAARGEDAHVEKVSLAGEGTTLPVRSSPAPLLSATTQVAANTDEPAVGSATAPSRAPVKAESHNDLIQGDGLTSSDGKSSNEVSSAPKQSAPKSQNAEISSKKRKEPPTTTSVSFTHIFQLDEDVFEAKCYICGANCKSNGEYFSKPAGYVAHVKTHESESKLSKSEVIERAKNRQGLRKLVDSDIQRLIAGQAPLHVSPPYDGKKYKSTLPGVPSESIDSQSSNADNTASAEGPMEAAMDNSTGRPARAGRSNRYHSAMNADKDYFNEERARELEDLKSKRQKRA